MWNFASNAFTRASGLNTDLLKSSQVSSECSDDDTCLNKYGDKRLECPICWESFNIVEIVPYVLWCGHTLCKNLVVELQRAVVKFPTLPVHFLLFTFRPWYNLFSLRLVYQGNVKFPSKNYFLLWVVESMNGDRSKSHSSFHRAHASACSTNGAIDGENQLRRVSSRRASCATHHCRNVGCLITCCFDAESFNHCT